MTAPTFGVNLNNREPLIAPGYSLMDLLDLAEVPLIVSRDRLVLARSEGHEYLVDYTLQELEERLPDGQFVRVHRGALVNVDAIESYGGEDGVLVLRLKDGTRVEASERRAAEVRRKLR